MTNETIHFPLHPLYSDNKTEVKPVSVTEEEDDKDGESGKSSGGFFLKPPYQMGDWQIDLNKYQLYNIKHQFELNLENLNSHPKYLKLFCTIGIRPDWDIQGLIGCLNWAAKETFKEPLDHMLIKTINEEGKKIDWRAGKIRRITQPIFKG